MMTFPELTSVPSDRLAAFTDQLRLAVAAYLARFTGSSREHTASDLRCYLAWCAQRGLDPLAARRPHLELYIRWMQEVRRFKPSTASRRFSVADGFYRTCVIDGLLEHSPAEHVRRPSVPAQSPTLGFTHLQFEAQLTAAQESPDPCDFALVAMLGLLGLRIFEATVADVSDLGEEHGHRVLRVCGKGTKVALIPLPPAVGRAIDRAIGTRISGPVLVNSRGARMDRHAATRRLRQLAGTAGVPIAKPHPHMLRHTFVTTSFDAGVDLRDVQIAARDPTTPKVRAGLYSVENHQAYLPDDAARQLSSEWNDISAHYKLLQDEGAIGFVDPTDLIAENSADKLVTAHLQADMLDQEIIDLFAQHPPSWSILRSRIPRSAFQFLHHQYTPRVLYDQNIHRTFQVVDGEAHALIADGKPDQEYSIPGRRRTTAETRDEYAVVVPYYLGSSLATSLALLAIDWTHSVPLTDSEPHFRLLSQRFYRAGKATPDLASMPGLKPVFSPVAAQTMQLVEHRIFDTILSSEDLAALSLEECLRYREKTAAERLQFRQYLAGVVSHLQHDVWSAEIENEISEEIMRAQQAMNEHADAMRNAYTQLFKRSAIGMSVATGPLLINAIFPGVSVLIALLLGTGTSTALLAEPIKEFLQLRADRKNIKADANGLSYLFKLQR
jgi:integrase/recombinase XerD